MLWSRLVERTDASVTLSALKPQRIVAKLDF